MKTTHTVGMALGVVALGMGLLGAAYAARAVGTQNPAYTSSIQTKDQDREGQGERHEDNNGEAGRLAALAKIEATQATAAASPRYPARC